MDRLIALEGVDNLRDYGGYDTVAGRRVRTGRLYRSAHHANATDADLDALHALGVAVVVDLRRRSEREQFASRFHADWAGRVIAHDVEGQDAGAEPPHVAFLRETDLSPDAVHAFMAHHYAESPEDPRHQELFRQYFAAIADGEGPVLIHCAAGKDRTGLLAALTHHVLGVSDEDIIADYLLTNEAARIEARAPEVARRLAELYGRTPSDAAVRTFLGVRAEYIQACLAGIRARHGSLDGYLDHIGVDRAMRERVAEQLLA